LTRSVISRSPIDALRKAHSRLLLAAIVRALAKAEREFYGSLNSNGTAAPFRARLFDCNALNKLIGTQEMLPRGTQYEAGSAPKTNKVEQDLQNLRTWRDA
jgi:hypothetical protein